MPGGGHTPLIDCFFELIVTHLGFSKFDFKSFEVFEFVLNRLRYSNVDFDPFEVC